MALDRALGCDESIVGASNRAEGHTRSLQGCYAFEEREREDEEGGPEMGMEVG